MIQSLIRLDEKLALWGNLTIRRERRLRTAASAIAVAGSWAAASLLAISWLRAYRAGAPRQGRVAERALLGVGITYLAAEGIGRALPRSRPFADSADTLRLVIHTERRSFPSRHVASAFAMSVAVLPASPGLAWSFAAIGAMLGAARIAAGVHYPSDVLGGVALGSVIGRIVRTQ